MKYKKFLKCLFSITPTFLCLAAVAWSINSFAADSANETSVETSYDDTTDALNALLADKDQEISDLEAENASLSSLNELLKNTKSTSSSTSDTEASDEDTEYEDGTYTGTGKGFSGKTKVSVTIASGKITAINILSYEDDESFIAKAKTLIPQMLEKQTANVDVVSGATYSSKGLKRAVSKALLKAEGDGDEEEEEEETVSVGSGSFPFADGKYQGTGKGYRGDVKLTLTIKNQTITAITVDETRDDNAYFSKAKKILDSVLSKQTLNVDAISGATYSSRGIKEALKDAMKEAAKSTFNLTEKTDSNTTTDTTGDSESDSTTEDQTNTYDYTDGTYQGQALCTSLDGYSFDDYLVNVSLTISDGKITAFSASSEADSMSADWFNDAINGYGSTPGMVQKILGLSSPDQLSTVDAVSGATCSSDAIKDAAANALSKAKEAK